MMNRVIHRRFGRGVVISRYTFMGILYGDVQFEGRDYLVVMLLRRYLRETEPR